MINYNQRRQKNGQNKTKNKGNEWKTVTNMVDICPTISTVTMNINCPSTTIGRQTVRVHKKKKLDPNACCLSAGNPF